MSLQQQGVTTAAAEWVQGRRCSCLYAAQLQLLQRRCKWKQAVRHAAAAPQHLCDTLLTPPCAVVVRGVHLCRCHVLKG
jgi:hypothetical protein